MDIRGFIKAQVQIRKQKRAAHGAALALVKAQRSTTAQSEAEKRPLEEAAGGSAAQEGDATLQRSTRTTSGFTGVGALGKSWRASFHVDGKTIHIGLYSSAVQAARARRHWAQQHGHEYREDADDEDAAEKRAVVEAEKRALEEAAGGSAAQEGDATLWQESSLSAYK